MMVPISGIWAVVIALVGLILTLLNIADKVAQFKAKAKEPNERQDERIAALEKSVDDLNRSINEKFRTYDEYFQKNTERLDKIEQDGKDINAIILRALHSIIDYDINGNNKEQLQKSKDELYDYLYNK